MKPLILLTDGGPLRSEGRLVSVLAEALKGASGHVESVLLREQLVGTNFAPLEDFELLKLAKQIRELCDEHEAKLILHTNQDLYKANLKLFSGIHLNKYSPEFSRTSEEGIFGYSAHDEIGCLKAQEAGFDYAFLSPVFSPNSKVVSKILGLKRFSEIKSKTTIPLVALGGVDSERVSQCADAGADAVAVIGSILNSADPAGAAEEIVKEFNSAQG